MLRRIIIKSHVLVSLQVDKVSLVSDIHRSRSQLDVYDDFANMKSSDLKLRIEEMLRIKVWTHEIDSVKHEL